ncbi:MAG: ATP-binding protein [Candidatus Aenigmatarchaeota archaeon]
MVVEKIIIGRSKSDLKEYGDEGTVFIGKHIVGEGEESHLTNPIHMDVSRPHVVLISGKRGSGKSYTSTVIAEEITNLPKKIRQNISVLMLDTMGIFWSMQNPNERDRELLEEWGLKPEGTKVKFFAPKGFVKEYEKFGIKVDAPIILQTSDLSASDWIITFGFDVIDSNGIAIEKVVKNVKKRFGEDYSIDDIIEEIKNYDGEDKTKRVLTNRFSTAKDWGIFEKTGTSISSIFQRGVVSIVDISHFERTGSGWSVRAMLTGLLARKIFQQRLMSRKAEEFEILSGEKHDTIPMVWIMIDEAHQFIPHEGKTAATEPLLTLIKEGREPGISLVLITQMPNRLNPDALAQADLVISHRLTSKEDIEALKTVMQTYMIKDISQYLKQLPKTPGSAIVLDDNSERIFPIQIRPRLSWHAGGSPSAIKKKSLFD